MKHTRQGELFTQIVLTLFKLGGQLTSEGDELTRALGLSSARWKVLGALAESAAPMTVSQIAHSMGQARQSVQRLADAMAESGILAYQKNPQHKKAKLVILTRQGEVIYEQLQQKQIPWANDNAVEIGIKDLEVTLSVLRELVAKFDG